MTWSKKEQALIDILKPDYISRDDEVGAPIAIFWDGEPTLNRCNYYGANEIAGFALPLFRKVKKGQCVKVKNSLFVGGKT